MAVEYGLFVVILILIFIIYLIIRNYNKENESELAILFMFLSQNITNDLVYAPDVAIYFWFVPFYFLANVPKGSHGSIEYLESIEFSSIAAISLSESILFLIKI